MKKLLRFLQALFMCIASIPMAVLTYLYFATMAVVMWRDMRPAFREYTKHVIELWEALVVYINYC